MKKSEIINILKKNSIFINLNAEELAKISDVAEEITYKKGEIIFKENETADAFYFIVKGVVEILKNGEENQQEILAVKTDNDVFGEMAVIDELPRSATIKAKTDLLLLKLDKGTFEELLKSFSHISIEIARSICDTVRKTNISYIHDLERQNKQLEDAYSKLKQTQDELISNEKLSIIGKFASLIIHDIKNPMANIRAYAELIKMTIKNDARVDKATGIIISEVDRLTKMTSELLEFARGEINLNKTPVNLSSLIETLVDTVKDDLEKQDIKFVFSEKTDVVIMLDSEKIKRVFYNLVSNATDAIVGSGLIIIRVVEELNWIRWSIQDNGVGMEIDVLERIFEPFFTNKKKGTGLGMAIVKSIIESHNGFIKAQSKKNTGTRFEIFFPKV